MAVNKISVALIGAGGMARTHMISMTKTDHMVCVWSATQIEWQRSKWQRIMVNPAVASVRIIARRLQLRYRCSHYRNAELFTS